MNYVKYILVLVIVLFIITFSRGQILSSKDGNVKFYSSTPVEDIQAETHSMVSALNAKTRKFAFSIYINTFEFPNKLMQEHFNEKYLESEQFPKATFDGVINDPIDLTKDGVYKVTVTGKLTIHGVAQDRTISGTVTVKGGKVTIESEFYVKLVDHNITVPEVVFNKIAESIKVNVVTTVVPVKK